MRVILISGSKGAGKSTTGALIKKIADLSEISATQTHFADFLKHACALAFEIPIEDFFSTQGKEQPREITLTGKTIGRLSAYYRIPLWSTAVLGYRFAGKKVGSIRELIQFVGTDMLRTVDPEIHIKALKATVRASKRNLHIISDLRFLNERDHFPDALHIHIDRLGIVSDDFHVSEQNASILADLADTTILNPGSLDGLALELYRKGITPNFLREFVK